MSQTIEARFERCCRLCAEEQDVTIMIFSQEAEAMLLQNKLNRYLLIEVEEDDKLPKNICIQCCAKLQTVCDFIDTARKAQEILLNRSIMLDQISPNECIISLAKNNVHTESEKHFDNDKYTEMEISVDPMMVLQNSEDPLSPTYDHEYCMEDVTYLHGLDAENVTIKLIKRVEKPPEVSEETQEEVTISTEVSNDTGDEKDNDMGAFQCATCQQSFCTKLALRGHIWAHIKQSNQTSGLCQLCGRMFRSEKSYIAHMTVHLTATRSYTCKICGRSYNTYGGLKTHSVTHSSERPYLCQYCNKTFKRNQDLKFHINQHTGEKPYKCPFCDKCFASSGNCYSHRSRMHPGRQVDTHVGHVIRKWGTPSNGETGLQPIAPKPSNVVTVNGIIKYQCHLCEHSFLKKENYNYHMYQHTGEKPFQCTFCTQKFMTRRGLLIHHDNKHPIKDRPLALISKNVLLK